LLAWQLDETIENRRRPIVPPRLLTERSLSRRAVAGDRAAFDEIYRRFHQDIFRYCRSIVGNEQDAMDALQNTMEKALAGLPGESREIRLKPWLFRVARNVCMDSLNARREQVSSDGLELESGSSVESEVGDRERLRELLSDISWLPEGQRNALVMRELSGLSFEEIGLALDCSPAAARQVVYEARISLRELETGRGMLCDEARQGISSMDGRVMRGRKLRAHLRSCEECEGFRLALKGRQEDLRSLVPVLPAGAAASILGTIGGGGVGGGLLAAFGGGAAATGAGTKAVAIIAVTAGIGAGTAGVVDRSASEEAERGSADVSRQNPIVDPERAGNSLIPVGTAVAGISQQPSSMAEGSTHDDGLKGAGGLPRDAADLDGIGLPGKPGERPEPPPAGSATDVAGPGNGAQGKGHGRSDLVPGKSEGGPPGRGAGRPAGIGKTGAGATGPPDHAQGGPAAVPRTPAPKPIPKDGKQGNNSPGPPGTAGGSGNGKSRSTP
jgi:RNA polymerase sigma factor (sigma-70 family)